MQKKLNKIAKDTNFFLRKFISKQKKTELIIAMKYGLFSKGCKEYYRKNERKYLKNYFKKKCKKN